MALRSAISSADSATSVDAAFSVSRSRRLVPGMGTIWLCRTSSQASACLSFFRRGQKAGSGGWPRPRSGRRRRRSAG